MSELRYNPITLDWVIMAPDRAHKPNDFRRAPLEGGLPLPVPAGRDNCPFCAGNEHLAPQEVSRATGADGAWTVRVIPNKFSAFVQTGNLNRTCNGTFLSMAAAGVHEVVIEHPDHSLVLTDMEPAQIAIILETYRDRFRSLRAQPDVASIVIFKNQGERAGSSLMHAHSQITAAPVLSSQVCMRLAEARRFHELRGGCLYCQVLEDELQAEDRIVEVSPSFAAFCPFASLSPFHTWIFPRKHVSSFDDITDQEIPELAGVLSRQLRRLAVAANRPDYNFTIRSSPVGEGRTRYLHWYLAIVPRINLLAGFELGSGSYINSLRPELCAEQLRSAAIE